MRVLNAVLLCALVAAAAAQILLHPDATQRNVWLLPDMVRTARYDAFESNPVFEDGKTLQAPPQGTVARGARPLRYGATAAEALRAGEELINPFHPADEKWRMRGADRYAIFCRPCHGPTGLGDGPVARRGYPPPPSLLTGKAVQMKDGQIFHIISLGQGNMPGHRSQIPPEDRWKIVLHVRSLQQQGVGSQNRP